MPRCKLMKGYPLNDGKTCDWCGKKLPPRRKRWCSDKHYRLYWNNHNYRHARKAVRRRDKYKCIRCGSKSSLEVNHIIPCKQNHKRVGCWHHMDNLELLCSDCHKDETNKQRAEGKFKK